MKHMKIKKRWILITVLFISVSMCSIPEVIHQNSGISESIGNVRNGKLKNGWLMPYKGKNFHYFSAPSYFIIDNAYVHSSVYASLMDAYKTCEATCPGKEFVLMECTGKNGGRMLFHWTHQNGMSVDFMTPIKRGDENDAWPNHVGLFHYLLKFNTDGELSLARKAQIDFETMSLHLLALDDAASKHDLHIRKILFHTDLHDNLFSTPAGRQLAAREINFIPHLNDFINSFHDDHYHVDFEEVNGE